jgi:hypothetical protein
MKFNCDTQNAQSWQIRAEKAVEILANSNLIKSDRHQELKIADFGCGNERLKIILDRQLNKKFQYYGYDLYPQDNNTYKLDLENEMPSLNFDIIFCLGLLEYLNSLNFFFEKLAKKCKFAAISYVVGDSKIYSPEDVINKGWVNHYCIKELESKLEPFFLKQDFQLISKGKTGLWLLQSKVNSSK